MLRRRILVLLTLVLAVAGCRAAVVASPHSPRPAAVAKIASVAPPPLGPGPAVVH